MVDTLHIADTLSFGEDVAGPDASVAGEGEGKVGCVCKGDGVGSRPPECEGQRCR